MPARAGVQPPRLVAQEEGVARRLASVQQEVDIGVPGCPGILEEKRSLLLKNGGQGVTQAIQPLAERPAPGLIPARAPAGAASTVLAPSADAVRAAPGALGQELHLPGGTMPLQVGRQVRHLESLAQGLPAEECGQTHVAKLVVMAEGLPVGRDQDQGVRCTGCGLGDAIGQEARVPQVVLEADAAREGGMIEAEVDPAISLRASPRRPAGSNGRGAGDRARPGRR